jgi:hypothetical protein
MAFDPTKPVEGSEIDAAELRNQFNGLKALNDAQQATIDAQQTQITAQQAQMSNMNSSIADLQDAIADLRGRCP